MAWPHHAECNEPFYAELLLILHGLTATLLNMRACGHVCDKLNFGCFHHIWAQLRLH